jgi:hypothetical protein
MSTHSITHSITHRPIPFAAGAAAVVAAAAFTVVVVSQDSSDTNAPAGQTQVVTSHHRWHPTTSGGQVQLGLP